MSAANKHCGLQPCLSARPCTVHCTCNIAQLLWHDTMRFISPKIWFPIAQSWNPLTKWFWPSYSNMSSCYQSIILKKSISNWLKSGKTSHTASECKHVSIIHQVIQQHDLGEVGKYSIFWLHNLYIIFLPNYYYQQMHAQVAASA